MVLTRDFRETIRARAQRDPAFRASLLQEAIETMLAGDVETGKAVLRDYIKATVGFETLAENVRKSPKSLMRMLSPGGNPRSDNLFAIIGYLQRNEGVTLRVRPMR